MLQVGGGALTLATDTFINGEPSGLFVSEALTFEVLEPIPPPEFTGNDVLSISFFGVSAYGFILSENFPNVYRTIHMANGYTIVPYKPFKYWNGITWEDVIAKRWNGTRWVGLQYKIYDGKTWT